MAHKLKLQVYDTTTGVYGFDSRDRLYGMENARVTLPVSPEEPLGLELTELAHATESGDERGLTLVSGVFGFAKASGNIKIGDTVIGVFAGDDYKESTTALNYDATMDVLMEAKQYAVDNNLDTIDLELNRLVKREPVKVIIEEDWRDGHGSAPTSTEIDALAGDNLRLLLMHKHLKVYDDRTVRLDTLGTGNCGGEGICGTCLVEVLEGAEHLNKPPPQESEGKFFSCSFLCGKKLARRLLRWCLTACPRLTL